MIDRRYLVPDTGIQTVEWEVICARNPVAESWWDDYAQAGRRWHPRCRKAALMPNGQALSLPVEFELTEASRDPRSGRLRCWVNTSSESARAGNLWSEGTVLDLTHLFRVEFVTRPAVLLMGEAEVRALATAAHHVYVDFGHTITTCLYGRTGAADLWHGELFRQSGRADWGDYSSPLIPSGFLLTPNRWRYRFEPAVEESEVRLGPPASVADYEPYPLTPGQSLEGVDPQSRYHAPKLGLGDLGTRDVTFTTRGPFGNLSLIPAVRTVAGHGGPHAQLGRTWAALALRGLFRAVYHELFSQQTSSPSPPPTLPFISRVVLTVPAAFNDWVRRDLYAAAADAIRLAAPDPLREVPVQVEVLADEATCIAYWAAEQPAIRDEIPTRRPSRPPEPVVKSPPPPPAPAKPTRRRNGGSDAPPPANPPAPPAELVPVGGLPLLVFDCGGSTTDVSLTTWVQDPNVPGRQATFQVERWFDGSVVCAGNELLWAVIGLTLQRVWETPGVRIDARSLLAVGAQDQLDMTSPVPVAVQKWARHCYLANDRLRGWRPVDASAPAELRQAVVQAALGYGYRLVRTKGETYPEFDFSTVLGTAAERKSAAATALRDIFPLITELDSGITLSPAGLLLRAAGPDSNGRRTSRRCAETIQCRLTAPDFARILETPAVPAAPGVDARFEEMMAELLGPLRQVTVAVAASIRKLAAGPSRAVSPDNPLRIVFAGGGTRITGVRNRLLAIFQDASGGADATALTALGALGPDASPERLLTAAKEMTVRGLALLDQRWGNTSLDTGLGGGPGVEIRLANAVSGQPKQGDSAVVFQESAFAATRAEVSAFRRLSDGELEERLMAVKFGPGQAAALRDLLELLDSGDAGRFSRRLPLLFPPLADRSLEEFDLGTWRLLLGAAALNLVPYAWREVGEDADTLALCAARATDGEPDLLGFMGRARLRLPHRSKSAVLVAAPLPTLVTVLEVCREPYPLSPVPERPAELYPGCVHVAGWPERGSPSQTRGGELWR
ncbi:hypothetical protein [Paludisphaera sp.]|uniref:hypothetical protein n=1 Tax=Paludisphaera sp. TaxID=2017432 RepID=UPI00301BA131